MHKFVFLILLTWIGSSLLSVGYSEGASCRASDASLGKFLFSGVSRVTKAKLFFRNDTQEVSKKFVVKGDFVAVRNVKPYGSCALFINQQGQESIGWLETNGLEDIPNPGLQDMANRWRLQDAQRSIEVRLEPTGKQSRFEARLNKPAGTLSGQLLLEAEVGPAFTLEVKFNSRTTCAMSGVFLGGTFMRVFSDTRACANFAGVYRKVNN
jgi:hypothetical protein